LYVLAICEIFLSSKGGAWPKWPNGKYAYAYKYKHVINTVNNTVNAVVHNQLEIATKMIDV